MAIQISKNVNLFINLTYFLDFFFRLDPQASISGVMLEVMNTEWKVKMSRD